MSNKMKKRLSPLSIALGTAAATTLAAGSATASSAPFQINELPSGYMQLAEGKCGEAKCGSNKGKSGKCGGYLKKYDANDDGKVTRKEFIQGHEEKFDRLDKDGDGVLKGDELHKGREGKCGGKDKMKEGKCGEGKCGSNMRS